MGVGNVVGASWDCVRCAQDDIGSGRAEGHGRTKLGGGIRYQIFLGAKKLVAEFAPKIEVRNCALIPLTGESLLF